MISWNAAMTIVRWNFRRIFERVEAETDEESPVSPRLAVDQTWRPFW